MGGEHPRASGERSEASGGLCTGSGLLLGDSKAG